MKKIVLVSIASLITACAFAQTFTPPAFAVIDTNYRHYANNVFGALEANRVTTGLLTDYGFDFTDPKIYNGSVLVDSTLMEQGIYSELYATLFTSRFNNNVGSMRHPSNHDSLCYIARQREVITLSGLLYKYNAIDPDAQANGKMQTVNGQLKDVYKKGVWQNPYQEFTAVAISPSIIDYKLTYCSVVLPSALFLSNMGSQVSNIQFDAADGQGYRTVTYDVPINLNYTDTGWKHWMFRITLTNGQQLYSHSKVHFDNTSNMAGSGGVAARGVIDRRTAITATESFNGVFGVADIVISYRNQNDLVLRRPLIIAEGLDPGWITSPEEPEGENTFDGFIRSVRGSGSAVLRNQISGNNIFDPNSPSDYDIVYINWRNGTDWLQRNELVLEEVIRWVNAHKQPLAGVMQPNVVLGSSMGGVIARMALGRMDRGGGINGAGGFAAHQTNLYVSLDAPHQGANVPLGYQAAARHATKMYISTGGLAATIEIIQLLRNRQSPLQTLLLADQPAARQLLTNRIDLFYNTANGTNQQFMQDLRTLWAYPDPLHIRSVAISNGSECAIDQEFAAGSALVYHHRSTKTRFIGDLIFMVAGAGLFALNVTPAITLPLLIPGSNKFELTLDIKSLANNGGNQVYYGNIKVTKKVLWLVSVSINIANKTYNAPTGLLPFDTYPGGFYTVGLSNQPGTASQDWMFTYDNSFFIQRRFSFIPTTSALDIGQGNTVLTNNDYSTRYIGATPPPPPLSTPFANFTTAFNANPITIAATNDNGQIIYQFTSSGDEPHEGLYIRSSNWLAEELNANINVRTNCSAFCTNSTITGNGSICNNIETYTAPFGIGAVYNWSVSNPALVMSNPVGNTLQLTRNPGANGNLLITVTINGACGNTTLTKTINIGAPTTTCQEIGNGTCNQMNFLCPSQLAGWKYVSLFGTWGAGGTGYHLQVNGGGYFNNGLTTQDITGNYFSVYVPSGGNNVTIWAMNSCGVSQNAPYVIIYAPAYYGCSGGRYMVSPNPASNTITVSPDAEISAGQKKNSELSFTEIEIINKTGSLKKKFKFPKGTNTATLDISSLPTDNYIVRIFNGTSWEDYKIIVAK